MPDAGRPGYAGHRRRGNSIRLKIYLVTQNAVVDALAQAVQRGVDVRVIIEEEPFGGGESNAWPSRRWRRPASRCAPPGAFVYSHEKSLVVDDRRVYHDPQPDQLLLTQPGVHGDRRGPGCGGRGGAGLRRRLGAGGAGPEPSAAGVEPGQQPAAHRGADRKRPVSLDVQHTSLLDDASTIGWRPPSAACGCGWSRPPIDPSEWEFGAEVHEAGVVQLRSWTIPTSTPKPSWPTARRP